MKTKTQIKETIEGYEVCFTIGNQTFTLAESIEDTKELSLETAEFFERMLINALKKLC